MVDENVVEETSQEDELNLVERAEAAAKRIEELNKQQEELIERMEKAKAKEMLGGRTEAGTPEPEKKELTPKEYAQAALRGLIDVKEE